MPKPPPKPKPGGGPKPGAARPAPAAPAPRPAAPAPKPAAKPQQKFNSRDEAAYQKNQETRRRAQTAERTNRPDYGGPKANMAVGGKEGTNAGTGQAGAKGRQAQAHNAQANAGRKLQESMPEDDPRRYMNPAKLYRRSQSDDVNSLWAPGRRLHNLQTTREELGVGKTQEDLTGRIQKDVEAGSPVDLREDQRGSAALDPLDLREADSGVAYREENPYDMSQLEKNRATDTPIMNDLQEYAQERLGQGLTTEEEGVIRGRGRDTLSANLGAANQDAAAGMAASGIDPRSGVGAQRSLQLERMRQGGLTDVERNITDKDLERKAQMEKFGLDVGQTAGAFREREREYDTGFTADQRQQEAEAREQERQYNVGATKSRGEFGATLGEREREYDVGQEQARQRWNEEGLMKLSGMENEQWNAALDYTESGRQAKESRRQAEIAAREAQPGALETTGTILGSIL